MQFKLTIQWANGRAQCDWHDVESMREEMLSLAGLLPEMIPGEPITIERVS